MDVLEKDFGERTVGSSGISVGTHLMFEAIEEFSSIKLFDDSREITKVSLNKYQAHVFNIYTVIRNIVNSYEKVEDITDILKHKNFLDILIDEINNIMLVYMDTTCKLIFWCPDYTDLYKSLNNGKPDNTNVTYLKHLAIRSFLEANKEKLNQTIVYTGYKLPHLEGDILITTNMVVDLLNDNNLTLMETHTSVVKTKSMFNTKYKKFGNNDTGSLPFMEDLLYFMGDDVFILTAPVNVKRELLTIAKANNWTTRTTKSKVSSDLNKGPLCRAYYSNFVRKYVKH